MTRRWTPEEEKILVEKVRAGEGLPSMPGRTEGAVRSRLTKMALDQSVEWVMDKLRSDPDWNWVGALREGVEARRIEEAGRTRQGTPRLTRLAPVRKREPVWSADEIRTLVHVLRNREVLARGGDLAMAAEDLRRTQQDVTDMTLHLAGMETGRFVDALKILRKPGHDWQKALRDRAERLEREVEA